MSKKGREVQVHPRAEMMEAVKLLREHLESIRINMEILEVLKLRGRISLTDKQFIEITELDQKHRRTFQDFVLDELPQMLETNQGEKNNDLMKQFLEWTGDLHISMQYLDRIIKDYLHAINLKDAGGKRVNKNMEVKDKRFWKFLDKMRTKPKMFESFEEPSETENSDQPADPEKDE